MKRTLTANGVSKSYGVRQILRNVSVTAQSGDCIGIIGENGSGKSTLIRILAGVLTPDKGTVTLTVGNEVVDRELIPQHVGFAAPYLRLYEEFTSSEMLHLHARLHGAEVPASHVASILARFGLTDRSNDMIRTYSSGLQQRMSLALAVHLTPDVVALDEPSVTLDRAGRELLEKEIHRRCRDGGIVLLATNDERERSICTSFVHVSESQPQLH